MAFPAPSEGIVLTHFVISADVERSRHFYVGVLGGEAVMEGEPTIVKLANSWIIINVGGGPTDDKPEVFLDVPADPNQVSAFLNIRVADIAQPVVVQIRLPRIWIVRAVVANIAYVVAVEIGLIGIRGAGAIVERVGDSIAVRVIGLAASPAARAQQRG